MYVEPENLLQRPKEKTARRIAYIPFDDVGNAYTARMRELLETFGSVERFAGIKRLLTQLPRSLHRYDAIIVNWMDNAIVDAGSGRLLWRGVAKLFARTLLMKPFAKRMIFVRHNNYPHHTVAGKEDVACRLIDRYARMFDCVITHSGAATGSGEIYCPHPLYRRVNHAPDVSETSLRYGLPADYFLVFGRIVPYKKIDALVEVFPAQRTLVVAGIIGDTTYAGKLARLHRPNFIFLPGHLDEADAQCMVQSARGVVIANAEADVVVSGTFFYALSLGRTVFALTTPFLEWVQQRIDNDLLVLRSDLRRLCRAIAASDTLHRDSGSRACVAHEFGDAAIHRALATALRCEARP